LSAISGLVLYLIKVRFIRRGHRLVRARVGGLRAIRQRRMADRCPICTRRRSRPGDAARDGDPEQRLWQGRARAGARHLQRRDRLALIIGPAIGGFITENLGWRWVFWINLPIGMIAIAWCLRGCAKVSVPRPRIDIPGLVTGRGAALALVWGLLRGNILGLEQP
jgi:hypothetical protein